MSKYWLGDAVAVAKVITLTIANESTGDTFSISVGGVEIASQELTATGTDADDVIAELITDWNTSTHPCAIGVTATAGGTGDMVLTADVAGWDFDVTPAVDISGATTFTAAVTTALAGPNVWDDGQNWWDATSQTRGTAPVTGDDVILRDSDVNICWGLDQSAVTLASLSVEESYTGKIGLKWRHHAASADGDTLSTAGAREYRQHSLKIGATRVDIGKRVGTDASTGSARIKIHNTVATETTVHRTGTNNADSGFANVRLRFDNASSNVYISSARRGVAIASDEPGETSSLSGLHFNTLSPRDWCKVGDGVTINHVNQNGGATLLQSAGTVATVNISGGRLTTEGDFVLTTLNVYGGKIVANHVNASTEIGTANLQGGELDMSQGGEPRTVGILNPTAGVFRLDDHTVTVTTWNEPVGRRSVTFA